MNADRRKFLKVSALFGFGLALGLPDLSFSDEQKSVPTNRKPKLSTMTRFCTPRGGCTEANFALFDKGPYGRGPFDVSY